MALLHFLDQKWVGEKDLKISAFDISVLRGFGIFDFLRTYRQKPFKLQEHVDRLFRSAKFVGIDLSWSKKEVTTWVLEGIKRNQKEVADFNIRIVATGGIGPDSVTPGKPSLLIIYSPALDYPQKYYQQGVNVITYQTTRVLAEAKSLNYLMGVIALQKAKKAKAIEAIYVDDKGKIYEGTTSNFFAVMDKTLITPPEGILVGVTRQVVINLARKLGIPVKEKALFVHDIAKFDEAFITASNKEVMPVVKINDQIIGKGKVGEVTNKLIDKYTAMTGREN